MHLSPIAGGRLTLPPPSSASAIPPLPDIDRSPPPIQVALPNGGQTQLPGVLWPNPSVWTLSDRLPRTAAPPIALNRADRPRLLRYDNSLPLPLVLRLVQAFSDPGEHVVDPFVGGGTTAIACWQTGRQCTGGDLNPHAIRFTAAQLLPEHAWPADRQPNLLSA